MKGPTPCHELSSLCWVAVKTLETLCWVSAYHAGNVPGSLEEVAPEHHLHPEGKSISLLRCPLSWCCGGAGVFLSHLTSWGHGGTAARTDRGIVPPSASCRGVEKYWGSPLKRLQPWLRKIGKRVICVRAMYASQHHAEKD